LVPARTVEDASTLVIQPFVISLANTYHYDNNHLIDLLANGGDLEEFKYLSLNHPFFSPFMLELDWLLDLKEEHMIEAFIESYSWVFKNFNVVTASTFAEYFGVHFPTTPEFHFSFKASSSPSFPHTAHLVIEWLANSDTRIARVGKHVVSALRYKRQPNDPFLTSNKTIDFNGPRFGENPANTINMDLVFDVDSLWQYEHGNRTLKRTVTLTYDGNLGDFYSPEASRQAEHSTRLGQDFIQGITQSRSHLPPLDCFCLKANIDRAGPKWKQRVHD